MPIFRSSLVTGSEQFQANRDAMLELVGQWQQLRQRPAELSEKSRPRFDKKGQLSPRERLSRVLDPGMPYLPLHELAGYLVDDPNPETSVPGASVLSGIGYVSGTRCLVYVDDAGISAGAMTLISARKGLRALEIALEKKLPFIHLVESAGANLMAYQMEMWIDGGSVFAGLARLSAAGIPTITVLHGASVAGGAYMPGMSDYVIGVEGNGKAYLAGPALLKAATGEVADDESLGGVSMHATQSGLVEYQARDDAEGIALCRDLVSRLNWQPARSALNQSSTPPRYDAEELLGLVSPDYRKPYDSRELMARLVDDSDLLEFKPDYGSTTVCVQARISGMDCGILANNGPIDTQGATKAAQFMQLCDQVGIPLVFLQNITGYLVGTKMEQGGMIKHGAKMIQAVTNVRVPKITVMVGASFGAGNYGMCGKSYRPDFIFTWPNAQIGVMSGESAARTMSQVMREGAERKGLPVDEDRLKAQEQKIIQHFDRQSGAFYTSGRLTDDGVIDPRQTRQVLTMALDICLDAQARDTHPNTFGVGRL